MTQAALPFDTHRFVQNLVASGFTEKQAEALAYEQVSLLNSNLATKYDIEAVKYNIEAVKYEIESLRLSTESKIEELRLSTQSDMNALRFSTESKIEELRLSTQANIEKAKSETMKWMFGAFIAQGTLIVGLIVALEKLL